MRDDYRTLTEQTMPGINQSASASGNMNSSRAGIADAVAQRGFNDRQADMTATIQDRLMGRRIDQQEQQFQDAMKANYGLKGAYTDGINAMGSMGDFMTGAGNNMSMHEQAVLDAARQDFNENRDFGLDQQIKFQGGILGNAVYDNNAVAPNYHNTGAATFGGAMTGCRDWYGFSKTFKEIKAMP